MLVDIDDGSGFCFGVNRAIKLAEHTEKDEIYCLGEIVHNSEEVKRLEENGMKTVQLNNLDTITNSRILIRAHGEPPSTYKLIEKNKNVLIDGTCPIVLKLQQKIRKAWEDSLPLKGQIVIFGKKDHAEVIGLVGQTNNQAIVIKDKSDFDLIDFTKPVYLFSQTTMKPAEYENISIEIQSRINAAGAPDDYFRFHNSICGHVSGRGERLKEFAKAYDIIVFVSGKNSSNGKVLLDVCRNANPNTFWATDIDSVKEEWFLNANRVGICGATSTPRWLMEQIGEKIKSVKK
jgi:4-hydroxy-3-methylbut-2-en-1-yl diphosphate reductase